MTDYAETSDNRASFPNVHLMAVGGISRGNITCPFRAGCRFTAIVADLAVLGEKTWNACPMLLEREGVQEAS